MKENFEIKLPEHMLGDLHAQKCMEKQLKLFTAALGEENAKSVLLKSFAIMAKVDELEDEGRDAEALELENNHDKWFSQYQQKVESYMDEANADAESAGLDLPYPERIWDQMSADEKVGLFDALTEMAEED